MDKSAPRFQAGSMSLPESAGEITAMVSNSVVFEVYTESETYRLRSPEEVDPSFVNPNAPWVSAKHSDVGSSNKIVARVYLQGHDMLNAMQVKNKEAGLKQLHTCKEALLACEKVRVRLTNAIESVAANISSNGIDVEHGRHVKDLPQVENLDDEACQFLINIKRAIFSMAYLAECLLDLPKKDNNFDSLKKTLQKVDSERYKDLIGVCEAFTPVTKHLIELRNFQEHPGTHVTFVDNFVVNGKNEVCYPTWYVDQNPRESIVESMKHAIDFLVLVSENMLVGYLFASTRSNMPWYVKEIPESDIDSKKPIKYQLALNFTSIG